MPIHAEGGPLAGRLLQPPLPASGRPPAASAAAPLHGGCPRRKRGARARRSARTNFNQLELICDLGREARLILDVAAEGERSRGARISARRPGQARSSLAARRPRVSMRWVRIRGKAHE